MGRVRDEDPSAFPRDPQRQTLWQCRRCCACGRKFYALDLGLTVEIVILEMLHVCRL